jgi:hypothetical protein
MGTKLFFITAFGERIQGKARPMGFFFVSDFGLSV